MTSLAARRSKPPVGNLLEVRQTRRRKNNVRKKQKTKTIPCPKTTPRAVFLLFASRCAHLPLSRTPTLDSSSGGWGRRGPGIIGLGVAFGCGHAQKHNPYISEAVFVGKYRHSMGPWLWDQWVRAAQHSAAAVLWLRGWAQVGLDWICREWVWNTADLQLRTMWWSREGVYCRLWGGKDVAPATPMKKEAWPWISIQHETLAMTSLVQWFLLCWISSECVWRLCGCGGSVGFADDWNIGVRKCGLVWLKGKEEM